MEDARTFLQDLAMVLCVAAVTTVICRRLRQPVVLGYLLAGLIVGPNIALPLFADEARIHTLSELGVILVMFSVGLEFSIRKLFQVIPTAGIIGVIQLTTMISLGYLMGQVFGWTTSESIFAGAMVAISSTMVVAKVFAEHRVDAGLRDTVFGVLVVQDLAAVLLLAILTAVSTGSGVPGEILAQSAAKLAGFLLVMVVVGFLIIPATIRAVARLQSSETLLVASIGLCFALALVAEEAGYSVALGAFLAGSLVAESGEGETVEHLIRPVRDMFAAIFFVSVGMVLDPELLLHHWPEAVTMTLVVLIGQIVSVSLGAFLSGRDLKSSIQAGMSLAQIGEFSFIIAGVGVASGAIGSFLYPVAVAVSAITTFTTPLLVRASGRVASFVDRRLPRPLQTFVVLYASWLEPIRSRSHKEARIRRVVRLLLLDVALLAAVLLAFSRGADALRAWLEKDLSMSRAVGNWVVLLAVVIVTSPFMLGIIRLSRSLGIRIAGVTLPQSTPGKLDLATAPRRALLVSIQLAVVSLVTLPLLAIIQSFLPYFFGLLLFAMVIGLIAVGFWRSATNLDEHVHAGAQMIVEVLARQSGQQQDLTLHEVQSFLPGIGTLTPVALVPGSAAIGQTLAQLNLRALSGASVIAIVRGTQSLEPTGRELLENGDVLALAGTQEAIDAARQQLLTPSDVSQASTAPS